MQLKGSNIVISGASHGLGKALAEQLHLQGANLYLLSRNIAKEQFPFKVNTITCDITNPKQVEKAFNLLPNFDILINSVGIPLVKPLTQSSTEEIQRVINTNLTGIIYASKYAIAKLKNSKNPFIINVISTSGKKARINETVYCASKWGLAGFTNSLRLELAPLGIKVISVYPGGMKSEHFWQGIKTKQEIENYIPPQEVAQYIVQLLTLAQNSVPTEIVIERKG